MKVCPQCNAVYDGHRWVPDPDKELERRLSGKKPERRLCPGCLRIEKGQVEGVVTLKGDFLTKHHEEIKNIVNRVARKRRHRNVTARVLDIKEDDKGIVIETTDEHLAERIGKEVEKAFKGDLEIKWQEKDHFVRVVWQRE